MDRETRELERQAHGPEARAHWLRELRRSGTSELMAVCRDCWLRKQNHEWPRKYPPECCDGSGRAILTWPERIDLAAYCGDKGAQLVSIVRNRKGMTNWCVGLQPWFEAQMRAAIVACELVIDEWERRNETHHRADPTRFNWSGPYPARSRKAIKAAKRWIEQPSKENAKILNETRHQLLATPAYRMIIFMDEGSQAYFRECIGRTCKYEDWSTIKETMEKELIAWSLG